MTDSIEQFIESLHLGCNFIATASLSGSAGDQAIPALAETAADDPAITLVDIGQDHIKCSASTLVSASDFLFHV